MTMIYLPFKTIVNSASSVHQLRGSSLKIRWDSAHCIRPLICLGVYTYIYIIIWRYHVTECWYLWRRVWIIYYTETYIYIYTPEHIYTLYRVDLFFGEAAASSLDHLCHSFSSLRRPLLLLANWNRWWFDATFMGIYWDVEANYTGNTGNNLQ